MLTRSDATELAELIRTRRLPPSRWCRRTSTASRPSIRRSTPSSRSPTARSTPRRRRSGVAAGDEVGPLHGVPFTVKDSFDTAGVLTQRGSPIFAGRVPDTDATSVARMKSAGAILLAKTNLPEFSYWIESDNLLTGRTNNPWDLDRTPGGSSGGESAAIAAGMSPLGLGTDLSISVRGPAAHTGIVGSQADARAHPDDGGLAARAAPLLARRSDGPHHPRPRAGVLAAGRARRRRRLRHQSRASSTPAWAPRRTGRSASAGWSTRGSARSTPRSRRLSRRPPRPSGQRGSDVEAVSIPALERDNAARTVRPAARHGDEAALTRRSPRATRTRCSRTPRPCSPRPTRP